jgi:hypothetical protein
MNDPKHFSEELQALVAESERVARETKRLIDLTRRLSKADARLARALNEIGATRAKVRDKAPQLT